MCGKLEMDENYRMIADNTLFLDNYLFKKFHISKLCKQSL